MIAKPARERKEQRNLGVGQPMDRDPVDTHVGSRLRIQRGLQGLSQTEVAEKLGLTFQAIQKYERGETRISASRLYQIAEVLGIPIYHFFEGLQVRHQQGQASSDQSQGKLTLDREAHELLGAFSAVTDPQFRRAVIQLLKHAARLPVPEDLPLSLPANDPAIKRD